MTHAVVDRVHQERHGHSERGTALRRNRLALFDRLWLREDDFVAFVRWQLPAVRRMRFTNIDAEEDELVAVLPFEFFEGAELGPIWSSGETPEDQHDRLLISKLHQINLLFAVMCLECELRGGVAELRPGERRTEFTGP